VWERREFYVGFGEKRPLGRLGHGWEFECEWIDLAQDRDL
jgi:hypothetical protein